MLKSHQSVSDSSHKHSQPALGPRDGRKEETQGVGRIPEVPEALGLAIVCFALHGCSTLSNVPNVPVCGGTPSSVKRRAHLPCARLAGERELCGERRLAVGGCGLRLLLYPVLLAGTGCGTALRKGCGSGWAGEAAHLGAGGLGWWRTLIITKIEPFAGLVWVQLHFSPP